MSMHDSGALASLSEGRDGHQETPRPKTNAPGTAGTSGDDHMVASTGHRPNHRPLEQARQEMMEIPSVKRQDQDKAHVTSTIPTAEKLHLSRDPRKIYPLRISPLKPTHRVMNALAKSVKFPPSSERQNKAKQTLETRLQDLHGAIDCEWTLAMRNHQDAHIEDKNDYFNHQSESSDSLVTMRQAYMAYEARDKYLRERDLEGVRRSLESISEKKLGDILRDHQITTDQIAAVEAKELQERQDHHRQEQDHRHAIMLEEMRMIKELLAPHLKRASAGVPRVAAPLDGPPPQAPNQAPNHSDNGNVPDTDPSPPVPPEAPSSNNGPPEGGDAGEDDGRGPPPQVLEPEDPEIETLSGMIADVINLANANSYGLPATTNAVANWLQSNTGQNTIRYKAKRPGVQNLQDILKRARAKFGNAAVVRALIRALSLTTTKRGKHGAGRSNYDDDDDDSDDDLPDMSRGGQAPRPPPRDPPKNNKYYEDWDRAEKNHGRRDHHTYYGSRRSALQLHLAQHVNTLPRPVPTRTDMDKKVKDMAPRGRTKKSIYSQYEDMIHRLALPRSISPARSTYLDDDSTTPMPMCIGDRSTIEERTNYYEAKVLEACAGDINIYYNPMSPTERHGHDDDDDFYADDFYAGYGPSGPSSDEDHAVDVESYPGYGPPNIGFTDNE